MLPFQHFFAICGREDGLERVWLATQVAWHQLFALSPES